MTIKRKTYRNFMYIMKKIQGKGYDKTEAEKITHRIFDEWNPAGMSIIARADMIVSKGGATA